MNTKNRSEGRQVYHNLPDLAYGVLKTVFLTSVTLYSAVITISTAFINIKNSEFCF
jgi:hypothetical protein